MRIDSCRKCGGAMMPHEKCDTCGNNISLITNPQPAQNNSPEFSSVTIFGLPQDGHFGCVVILFSILD